MKKLFLTVLMIIGAKTSAQGIYIEGMLDCGKWLDARKQGAASVLEHYVIGVVNGISLGSGQEIWRGDGNKTTRTQLYYWMDSYCTKNPLNDVIPGVMEFADQKTFGGWRKPKK